MKSRHTHLGSEWMIVDQTENGDTLCPETGRHA